MSVSFQVLMNGFPTNKFIPERGSRQRDPLSPFLFMICAEGFSTFWKAMVEQSLRGLRLGQGTPEISHLFIREPTVMEANR